MKLPSFSSLSRMIGVDLGSSQVRIWNQEDGVVVAEPSCIAVDERSKKVIAVGSEALSMEGRVSSRITVYHPIQHGAVWDVDLAQALLRVLLQQVYPKSLSLVSPIVMINVPAGSTEAGRENLVSVVEGLGVREVYTIAQPLAAAIGAGVPIADASGSFVLQLGGGVAEGAVISLGSLVAFESIPTAGVSLNRRIRSTLKQECSLAVSGATVESLLKSLVTVRAKGATEQLVAGQDIHTGGPAELRVSSQMLTSTAVQVISQYEQLLQRLLSHIPPELTVDVIDKGLLLSGGLAQLQGVDEFLISRMGIPVTVVDEPELAVIKGVGSALEHLDLFKESLGYQE